MTISKQWELHVQRHGKFADRGMGKDKIGVGE